MLLQFYFSNYKSFSEETMLDLRASSIRELKSHVREVGNDKVLPLAVVYGPNASGKSKLFEAFEFMSRYVVLSLYLTDDIKYKEIKSLQTTPFAFSQRRNEPSEFDVYYVQNEGRRSTYYNYGFILDKEGVVEEWLYINTKTGVARNEDYRPIFHRKRGEKTEFERISKRYQENIEISIDNKVLIVSLGAKLQVPILKKVKDWFHANFVFDFSDPFSEIVHRALSNDIVEDDKMRKRIIKYLNSFDDTIIDLEFERKKIDEEESINKIYSYHNNQDGGLERLSIDEESAGTTKMFVLYRIIKNVLDKGAILFADEMDTKLHPLLMRNIILTFTDPKKNPNNAQLIFTTHNTIYLAMDLMRRDEIWFTEKIDGMSELYSLDDVEDEKGNKIRSDADYVKNYLVGAYGATPEISLLFGEDEDGGT